MKIHMTEKMLRKIKFSISNFEGNLNINGYDKNDLEKKVCSHCLLKSFKLSDTMHIEDLIEKNKCHCLLNIDPMVSLKIKSIPSKRVSFF